MQKYAFMLKIYFTPNEVTQKTTEWVIKDVLVRGHCYSALAEPSQIMQNHRRSCRAGSKYTEPVQIMQNNHRSCITIKDHAEPAEIT